MYWYDVAFSLDNPFDYELFLTTAKEREVQHELDRYTYCCWVGQIMGQLLISNKTVIDRELYMLALNHVYSQPNQVVSEVKTQPRSCCGGGTVL